MKTVSVCHNAPVHEETSSGGTIYSCCNKCKDSCDIKLLELAKTRIK